MRLYAISKIFYSPQDERVHGRLPAVFIRFGPCTPQPTRDSACSNCGQCGSSARPNDCKMKWPKLARICNFGCKCVVLTGCEPEAQLDAGLVDALHAVGFSIAVETSGIGTLDQVSVDWLQLLPGQVRNHA